MSRRNAPIFAAGVRVALCTECGSVHFQLVDDENRLVAVALLGPDEATGTADLLMQAVAEVRARDAGGRMRCH